LKKEKTFPPLFLEYFERPYLALFPQHTSILSSMSDGPGLALSGLNPMKLLMIGIALALFPWPNPSYLDAPCGKFVCRRAHRSALNAQELWDGGNGQLQVVQVQPKFEYLIVEHLREGDVIAFHGIHVAVYTHGDFMDSTPEYGQGRMQYRRGDLWYAGPVRVLRWKN